MYRDLGGDRFNVVEGALKSFGADTEFEPSPEMDTRIRQQLDGVNAARDADGELPIFYVALGPTKRKLRLGGPNDMSQEGRMIRAMGSKAPAAAGIPRRAVSRECERMNEAQAAGWPKPE